MSGRVGQYSVESTLEPSPDGRVGQFAIEVTDEPDDVTARVGQVSVEILNEPDTAKARVGQFVVEVVVIAGQPIVITGSDEMPNLTASEIITQKHVRNFIQYGGPRPNNLVRYSGQDAQYMRVTGVSASESGGIDPVWVQDPRLPGKYKMVARTVSPQDLPNATLELYEKHGLIPRQLIYNGCILNVYDAVGNCKDLSDFSKGWSDYVMVYSMGLVTDKDLGDRSAFDADESLQDSLSLTLSSVYPVGTINFENEATTTITAEVYDAVYGSNFQCGDCGPQDDGTSRIYALAKRAASEGIENFVVYTVNGSTWSSVTPVNFGGATAHVAIDIVGNYLLVVGTDNYFYCPLNSVTGEPASSTGWTNVDVSTLTGGDNLADVYVLSPREIFFVGVGGKVYKSTDITGGSSSFSVVSNATATSEDLARIHGKGDCIVAVGGNGAVIRSKDRGRSFATVTTEPGSNPSLQAVAVKDDLHWWVGTGSTGNGTMYYTLDGGETTWTSVDLPGMATATAEIKDIVFATDEVGYVSLKLASGVARIFTTWCGGKHWTYDYRMVNLPTSSFPSPGVLVQVDRIAVPRDLHESIMANNVTLAGLGTTGTDGYLLVGIAAKL